MANQFLSLGLFIMLLSFFIVLNSMSTFEVSKSRAVIASVTEAFLNELPGEKDLLSQDIAEPAQSIGRGSGMDKLEALFQSTIPGAKTRKNRLGTIMSLQVPRADFESALNGDISSDTPSFRGQFIKILISLLDSRNAIAYEMSILLNTPQNPASFMAKSPAKASTQVSLAASYSNKLEQEGLSRKLITSGLTKGKADHVTLTFKRYVPMKMELSQ